MIDLPVIDLKHYKATGDPAECAKAAESLHKYGVLCVRDEVRRPAYEAPWRLWILETDASVRVSIGGSARRTPITRRSST
jgi:hypothetical protein